MIEIISASRCTGCNICVRVCPMNVFDAVADGLPRIARQNACQSCFLCEAWCPEDALYVAPEVGESVAVNEQELAQAGVLGSYRRQIGWTPESRALRSVDQSFELLDGGSLRRTG